MALAQLQINDIENVLKSALRNKFLKYKPEPAAMTFHTRLLGTDRLALYSFIHPINTNFGMSIFKLVAGAYKDLLDIFERVGIELRSEIDEYFSKFNLR